MAPRKKKAAAVTAAQLAVELAAIRERKAELIKQDKTITTALLQRLHEEQLLEAGNYQISKKSALKIENEDKAVAWATEMHCMKVDTSKALQILRRGFEEPEKYGFSRTESESIVPILSATREGNDE